MRDETAPPPQSGSLAADFDDLATGLCFTTRGRSITESDLVSFACITGDMHPQHTDSAWAAESPFGGRIAHGMLILSYAFGLIPFDPERVVALRGVRNAVFKRPVPIGDTIRARVEIDRLTAVDDATGLVALRLDVLNQRDRVVARCAVEVVWRRGRGAAVPRMDEAFELVGLPI
jgi:3-hydroxybutyryl-CoA dehydratase